MLNTWQVHDEKKEEIERETLRRQKAEEYQWSIEGTRVTPDKQVYFVDEEGNIYLPVVEEREEEDAQSQLSQDNADGSEEEYETTGHETSNNVSEEVVQNQEQKNQEQKTDQGSKTDEDYSGDTNSVNSTPRVKISDRVSKKVSVYKPILVGNMILYIEKQELEAFYDIETEGNGDIQVSINASSGEVTLESKYQSNTYQLKDDVLKEAISNMTSQWTAGVSSDSENLGKGYVKYQQSLKIDEQVYEVEGNLFTNGKFSVAVSQKHETNNKNLKASLGIKLTISGGMLPKRGKTVATVDKVGEATVPVRKGTTDNTGSSILDVLSIGVPLVRLYRKRKLIISYGASFGQSLYNGAKWLYNGAEWLIFEKIPDIF